MSQITPEKLDELELKRTQNHYEIGDIEFLTPEDSEYILAVLGNVPAIIAELREARANAEKVRTLIVEEFHDYEKQIVEARAERDNFVAAGLIVSAKNTELSKEIERLRAIVDTPTKITIDPDGLVIFTFDSWEGRAQFFVRVPTGIPAMNMRYSTQEPWTASWDMRTLLDEGCGVFSIETANAAKGKP